MYMCLCIWVHVNVHVLVQMRMEGRGIPLFKLSATWILFFCLIGFLFFTLKQHSTHDFNNRCACSVKYPLGLGLCGIWGAV